MKIKTILNSAVALTIMGTSACGNKAAENKTEDATPQNSKAVVCYFSASGVTAKAAERLAEIIDAKVVEITPEKPYTQADLDWRDAESRSSKEKADRSIRPAIKAAQYNLADYEFVFLGFPNWWNTYPNIIASFIEGNDLKGKTIIPFMTSGGSGIENSVKELKESYPDLKFAPGLLMNDVSDEDIETWLKGLGI